MALPKREALFFAFHAEFDQNFRLKSGGAAVMY